MRRLLALLAVLTLLGVGALAQGEPGDEDNGFLINLIQERLSAPGRRIALGGVSGALTSQARIEEITLSDDQGPGSGCRAWRSTGAGASCCAAVWR